jgi:hypothetical protein
MSQREPITLEQHREAGHTVIRYVATYMDGGLRTLMQAAQGRYTYATPAEAQAWIDAVFSNPHSSPSTLENLWGKNPRCEVRPCECWAGHFDPVGVYFVFDEDDENGHVPGCHNRDITSDRFGEPCDCPNAQGGD